MALSKTVKKKSVTTKVNKITDKPETSIKNATSPKNNEIAKIVETLNKKFGNNAINLGVPKNSNGDTAVVKRLPTGSVALDMALGGGIPLGRFTEISGGLSTTKSTQCIHIVREAQNMGLVCAWIDVEGTTDEAYLRACDVDVDTLLYSRADGMEEALQMLIDLQRSGEVHLAILDSIAALSPTKEQESTMEDTIRMGVAQQLLGEYFRKFYAANNRLAREGKEEFTLIGINQLREKIGAYGDPEYTPGGRAKGFAQTVEIRFRRGDWIKEGTGANQEIVGQVVKFKIEKNKTFRRMQSGSFDFYFAQNKAGVKPNFNDNAKSLILLGVEFGIIEKAGAWFKYDGAKYQGVPALVSALRSDTELMNTLYTTVLSKVTGKA